MKKTSPARSLRIIGGNWRSRKVSFPDRPEIRPTPDRVRETLFNWLSPWIAGAQCLELYAGSGVLSMEALSRGAGHVTLIERDRQTCASLKRNLLQLAGDESRFTCVNDSALNWLEGHHGAFDIVFLDPPFSGGELEPVLNALVHTGLLASEALVYLETPAPADPTNLPPSLTITRQGKAGQVHYCLCTSHG